MYVSIKMPWYLMCFLVIYYNIMLDASTKLCSRSVNSVIKRSNQVTIPF